MGKIISWGNGCFEKNLIRFRLSLGKMKEFDWIYFYFEGKESRKNKVDDVNRNV